MKKRRPKPKKVECPPWDVPYPGDKFADEVRKNIDDADRRVMDVLFQQKERKLDADDHTR